MRFRVPDRWSILLTFEKLKGWTGCTSNVVALQKNDPGAGFGGWVCAGVIWGNVAGAASDVRLQADHIRLGGAGLFCSPPKLSPPSRPSAIGRQGHSARAKERDGATAYEIK
jgi:hypothetical protein